MNVSELEGRIRGLSHTQMRRNRVRRMKYDEVELAWIELSPRWMPTMFSVSRRDAANLDPNALTEAGQWAYNCNRGTRR